VKLADDPSLRRSMGSAGRRRIESELAWEHQAPRYIAVYDQLSAPVGAPEPTGVER
jgi:glycosyltransferase involved in cell wall biosynthesis